VLMVIAGRIRLDDSSIVTDPSQPSFVEYGVAELAGYLLRSGSGDGADYVVVTGATPRGTKLALAVLMKRIRIEGGSAFLDAPLDVVGRPACARRGMHFNGWAFNYPYTFRPWREEDWQRYLDILAYQGVNLFYLWPFIEIMPVPLSPEDEAYLQECNRVVDYAQRKHGMEVWIMQCTNRVARHRCGVADPRRRPYWRPAQEDLDPGKPEHLQAILESREALYRIVDKADGVCNIDSDPGYCPGSPLGDYVKVLQGCRELLDRHNVHGKSAKLISWMWMGWGRSAGQGADPDPHQILTIQNLKRDLPEPWALVAGLERHLPLCDRENVLAKTIFVPYGLIEGEPSYPATNVHIDELRAAFDRGVARYPELAGVMGNLQTPLLQFPNMYFFTSAMLDIEYRKRSEKEVLLDLAGLLYPEHARLLAEGFLALKDENVARILSLVDPLDRLLREDRLGKPGLFGRKLFPDHRIVARSLAMQLRLRASRERLLQGGDAPADQAEWTKRVQDYAEAYLAWDTAHGWHTLWGWTGMPIAADPRFPAVAGRLARVLGGPAGIRACFERMARALAATYDEKAVNEGCLAPLEKLVLSALPVESLAQKAKASASVSPDPARYPASAANDGNLATLYWPGALVQNNTEWLRLDWDAPQTFDRVVVRFLPHPSMPGRTIHLQKEAAPGAWEDFATTVIPNDPAAPHAVATFRLPTPITLDRIRVMNLLDLFEIEVR